MPVSTGETREVPTPPTMSTRHVEIMQLLKDQGHASVSSLSERFGVSEVTVRKDLQTLEERKLLVRTHGGAVLKDHFDYDMPFEQQAARHAEEKARIGKAAADLVDDHDTLILGFGSTTRQVARHLRGKRHLTVATDSMYVGHELMNNLDAEVLMLGGQLRPTTGSVVGPFAERMLSEYAFKKLFLGVDGYDIGHGLTTTSTSVSYLNRAMIEVVEDVILVTDSSKFGRRGLSLICDLDAVDILVTDELISDEMRRHVEENDVRVIIA